MFNRLGVLNAFFVYAIYIWRWVYEKVTPFGATQEQQVALVVNNPPDNAGD